jgi:3',5'-cyclic AMP phosphodiesterase CpdA
MTYKKECLRILLISDIHLNSSGVVRESVDAKENPGNIADSISGDKVALFFETLEKIFPYDGNDFPKAVVVAGDLVNKGGTEQSANGHTEFDAARDFLRKLASKLKLKTEDILVVPGNHDVDWSLGLDQRQRFSNYLQAVTEFSSPNIIDKHLTPRKITINGSKLGCYDVEILLLVSPTYSGIANSEDQEIARRIFKPLEDIELEESIRQQILNELHGAKGRFDIAAIGHHQRQNIRQIGKDTNSIRIAVLHHHILPDSQLEITNFEAVIDSGKVLDELTKYKFDLVLTGHKHNKQLYHFGINDQNYLDVYSSPSLFSSTETCGASFTVIEINKINSLNYATLKYFQTTDGKEIGSNILVRRKKIVSEIIQKCNDLSPEAQQEFLNLAEDFKNAFQWKGGKDFRELFNRVWVTVRSDFSDFGHRKLIFRSPNFTARWRELIGFATTINCSDQTLKLVSNAEE